MKYDRKERAVRAIETIVLAAQELGEIEIVFSKENTSGKVHKSDHDPKAQGEIGGGTP